MKTLAGKEFKKFGTDELVELGRQSSFEDIAEFLKEVIYRAFDATFSCFTSFVLLAKTCIFAL